jgi:hypothetical protein
MLRWIVCAARGRHEPRRVPIGGFRCRECGAVGADLNDMGFDGEGYVGPLRRIFSRENGTITRTASWDTGRHLIGR